MQICNLAHLQILRMSIYEIFFVCFAAVSLCAYAAEIKEKETAAEPEQNKEKRQAQDGFVPSHFVYRPTRKQV